LFPRASDERHRHDRIGRTSPSHLRAALFALFAVSGFAGLIYESIWTQYLKLFLGHAAYAQALVLAIFMGGMAVGSFICSRWSPGWRKLLIAYAATEAAIGALGLIFAPRVATFPPRQPTLSRVVSPDAVLERGYLPASTLGPDPGYPCRTGLSRPAAVIMQWGGVSKWRHPDRSSLWSTTITIQPS